MRRGRERAGGSARVFVRPVVMLAVGMAAGLAMWRVLMRGTFEAAAGPPNKPAQAVGLADGVGAAARP
jgi:hypothetical protein